MNIYQELRARNFIHQETDAAAIEKILTCDKVRYYVGFDPTGSSLHVGHLLPIMGMRLLQRAGHTPVVLVGGATAQIGDPSGKQSARVMLTREAVAENAACLKAQLARFISVDDAIFVDNNDWLGNLTYIDFLRDVGPIFSVNRMLAQESVKSRLENGLSFLEFNYSILQAYDFRHLFKTYNCRMQFGGQDQWGNMVAGTELVRRTADGEVYAMTFPLLLDSNGQKFGKTAGGNNVWLDVNRTSVFDYYQFWRNSDDSAVSRLLKYFTALPVEEIDALVNCGNINRAKEILAYEASCLAHGKEEAAKAYAAAGSKFGFADPEKKIATTSDIVSIDTVAAAAASVPTVALAASEFAGEGCWIAKLFVDAGLAKSNGEARRLIQGGGAYCNEERITDDNMCVTEKDFASGSVTLRAGKKNFRKIVLQ